MDVTVTLNGSLLGRRQAERAHWLAQPQEKPLSTRATFAGAGVVLENELCVYVQDARYSDGPRASGHIVTRRPCETILDLTPAEATDASLSLGLRYFLKAAVGASERRPENEAAPAPTPCPEVLS